VAVARFIGDAFAFAAAFVAIAIVSTFAAMIGVLLEVDARLVANGEVLVALVRAGAVRAEEVVVAGIATGAAVLGVGVEIDAIAAAGRESGAAARSRAAHPSGAGFTVGARVSTSAAMSGVVLEIDARDAAHRRPAFATGGLGRDALFGGRRELVEAEVEVSILDVVPRDHDGDHVD